MSEQPKQVYAAIASVMQKLSQEGISKDRKNLQQGYSFRGIDDIYNALAPKLAEEGLIILPRMIARVCEERQTKSGGVLFYVTVEAEFDFVSSKDGSSHTVKTFGEAMDSADKATNKAMSAAYKYAAFQTFCIPTEGDNDTENSTPEPAPRHQGGTEFKASEEQLKMIRDLCQRKQYEPKSPITDITAKDASAFIKKLQTMPDAK